MTLARTGNEIAMEVMPARRMTRERIFLVKVLVIDTWQLNGGTLT